MRRGVRLAAIVSLLAFAASWSAPGRAAGFLEKNFWLSGPNYDAALPACNHPLALTNPRLLLALCPDRRRKGLQVLQGPLC